jgi:hypothetical protein
MARVKNRFISPVGSAVLRHRDILHDDANSVVVDFEYCIPEGIPRRHGIAVRLVRDFGELVDASILDETGARQRIWE